MIRVLALLIGLASAPVHAVEPDEVLVDPAQESRARTLSAQLRCLVCQNQSIDDSDAPLAKDLRILVRDRIQAGDNDEQVKDFIVDRYGEFVLLRPRFSAANALLWSTPLLILILGGVALARSARGRAHRSEEGPLSPDERKALTKILEQRD